MKFYRNMYHTDDAEVQCSDGSTIGEDEFEALVYTGQLTKLADTSFATGTPEEWIDTPANRETLRTLLESTTRRVSHWLTTIPQIVGRTSSTLTADAERSQLVHDLWAARTVYQTVRQHIYAAQATLQSHTTHRDSAYSSRVQAYSTRLIELRSEYERIFAHADALLDCCELMDVVPTFSTRHAAQDYAERLVAARDAMGCENAVTALVNATTGKMLLEATAAEFPPKPAVVLNFRYSSGNHRRGKGEGRNVARRAV
jgi:hypothetical protein